MHRGGRDAGLVEAIHQKLRTVPYNDRSAPRVYDGELSQTEGGGGLVVLEEILQAAHDRVVHGMGRWGKYNPC
jgi:hypothetical protein